MIKKLNKLPNIVKAVGLVTVISAVGKVLGFVREAIIAAYFGASKTADVFFVANMIPTLLYTAIGIAIYSGIIPIYLEEKAKSQAKADKSISVLGTVFVAISAVIALLAYIFSKPLVNIVAPGFTKDQLELTSVLTRIMLPSIIFLALTSISTGVLNAHKKFVAPSLTATAQNIIIILATVLFAEKYGIMGLAAGVLIGSIGQFIIQLPQMTKYNIKFNFSFRKEKERIINTLILFYPIIVASIMVQINGLTDRMISSGLQAGSVSALNYANKLMQLPLSVIMAPLITVLYPSIVENAIKGMDKFIEIVLKGAKTIIYLSIPFVVVMVVCSRSLIAIAFQRGAFDASDTSKTMIVFIFYSLGLVFYALRDYLMNCLFAIKETKKAMYTSIFMVIINVALSLTFTHFIEAAGLALSSAIATLVQTLFITFFLWKKARPSAEIKKSLTIDIAKFLSTFVIVMGASYPFYLLAQHWSNIIQIIFVSLIAFLFFFIISSLLKVKESKVILQLFKKGH